MLNILPDMNCEEGELAVDIVGRLRTASNANFYKQSNHNVV